MATKQFTSKLLAHEVDLKKTITDKGLSLASYLRWYMMNHDTQTIYFKKIEGGFTKAGSLHTNTSLHIRSDGTEKPYLDKLVNVFGTSLCQTIRLLYLIALSDKESVEKYCGNNEVSRKNNTQSRTISIPLTEEEKELVNNYINKDVSVAKQFNEIIDKYNLNYFHSNNENKNIKHSFLMRLSKSNFDKVIKLCNGKYTASYVVKNIVIRTIKKGE